MHYVVTSKYRVTIPKEIRELLNIRANDRVEFVLDGNRILLVPFRTLKDLRGAVPAKRKGGFVAERARAKSAMAKRVRKKME